MLIDYRHRETENGEVVDPPKLSIEAAVNDFRIDALAIAILLLGRMTSERFRRQPLRRWCVTCV